ncbi:hypothetical protein RRF57_001517 [Xylaria bambusicola]|uniref:Uncharacterized protein n=1 Tax=Xylaria bambusicola TaxID=326684 RepID=A0AAN7UHD4_9PEZI
MPLVHDLVQKEDPILHRFQAQGGKMTRDNTHWPRVVDAPHATFQMTNIVLATMRTGLRPYTSDSGASSSGDSPTPTRINEFTRYHWYSCVMCRSSEIVFSAGASIVSDNG